MECCGKFGVQQYGGNIVLGKQEQQLQQQQQQQLFRVMFHKGVCVTWPQGRLWGAQGATMIRVKIVPSVMGVYFVFTTLRCVNVSFGGLLLFFCFVLLLLSKAGWGVCHHHRTGFVWVVSFQRTEFVLSIFICDPWCTSWSVVGGCGDFLALSTQNV